MRRPNSNERGQAYLVLLVLAILATMVGMTMIVNSTAGITSEAKRDAQDRARMNSESGLTMADFRLKAELPALFKQLVMEANADDDYGGQMMLAGLTFDPVKYRFAVPGEGNTEEDVAEVSVELRLPAPPVVSNTSGVSSGPEVGTVETYCFVAHLSSIGHARLEATWTSERVSHVYVTTVMGEVESETLSELEDGNVINLGAIDSPMLRSPATEPSWELVSSVYAAGGDGIGVGPVTMPPIGPFVYGPGGTSTGGWVGGPEVVTGMGTTFPIAVGQPNGDTVFFWWLRGLPAGTRAVATSIEGAEVYVLAVDAWRFEPSYSRTDDMISYQRPDTTIGRKFGSPRYGVVAVRAPAPYKGALGAARTLSVTINVPGRGSFSLEVAEGSWRPNSAVDTAPDGNEYRIVGTPRDFEPSSPLEARIVEPTPPVGGPVFSLNAVSESVVRESRTDITVPGDAASGGLVGTGGSGGSGNIVLMTVRGRLANVSMQWSDGRATPSTINSRNVLLPAEPIDLGGGGGPGIIVDPPPPGGRSKVRILAVMYVPLWTSYTPERWAPRRRES